MQPEAAISKILSPNDTGETGAHQAGMLISKKLLSFFPKLDGESKNPRAKLHFSDNTGGAWVFTFIYYNNKLRGGTRNEYRLTGMTRYIKESGLKPGDEVTLSRSADEYLISHQKNTSSYSIDERGVIVLGKSWKIINVNKRDLC